MSTQLPLNRGASPRELLRRVIEVCDRYEHAWRSGQQPAVTQYVPEVPEPERTEFLRELLALDIRLLRERGEDAPIQQYQCEFPDRSELIASVFQSLDGETRPDGDTFENGAGITPSQPGAVPSRIGKYIVLNPIDSGGQGSVFRVLHPHLQGEFVLKLAHSQLDPDAPERAALISEGRTLVRLDHPGLARVIDLDLDADRPFLVLEYVRGRPLDRYAVDVRPGPKQAARLVAALARTVAYLHAQGVVHQDIKPRNIVLDGAGQPHLIDFGLARLQQTWSDGWNLPTGGTPQFMAPEQARLQDERVGPACDLFALGGVLYFLLTGKTPFAGQSRNETLAAASRCAFDRSLLHAPGIPRRLARIVLRAMAEEPTDRQRDAEALAGELDRYVKGYPRSRLAVALIAAAIPPLALITGLPRLKEQSAASIAPIRIDAMEIHHYRDDPAQGPVLIGIVGTDRQYCLLNDAVRIRAKLSTPAYGYLVALHPNGQTELYYPQSQSTPAPPFSELSYPSAADLYSPLTDGAGLQAFALIVTDRPLPPYREWIDRGGDLPWGPTGSIAEGVWRFDGRSFERLDPELRSQPRQFTVPAPALFARACRSLAARPEVRAIQAWAFPVRAKAEPVMPTQPEKKN
jgi:serine/threonine protein kinase